MDGIRRIGSVSHSSSAQRRSEGSNRLAPETVSPEPKSSSRANAGLGGIATGFRPSAGFLAQYVDQHHSWPRAPLRKVSERQRATRAYIVADMLQDLLAETRRPRPTDEKL
jgi:hypothetical protein